jgi:hypothetical protein
MLMRRFKLPEARDAQDRQEIRDLIEGWALWRDTGDWEALASVWHPKGVMRTTWFEASGQEFVKRSRAAAETGAQIHHFMGGTTIEQQGDRAAALTRMQITQRGELNGVVVDVECKGLFWDAIIREAGKWQFVLRQPIYEADRMSTLEPGARLSLDSELLARFPYGYKHLAYLQTKLGIEVNANLPTPNAATMESYRKRGRNWLAGQSIESLLTDRELGSKEA